MKKDVIIKIDKSRLRPFDVQTLVCDNNKAKKLLNWSPEFTIEEGLKKTVEWAGKSGIKLNSSFTRFQEAANHCIPTIFATLNNYFVGLH